VPLIFSFVLSLDLKFVSVVFFAGVTCGLDLPVCTSAAYFGLGSVRTGAPHFGPHFCVALFLFG
jgi:hypothetical protein